MPRKLKVYRWQTHVGGAQARRLGDGRPGALPCEAIMAAPSMAAVGRAIDCRPAALFNLGETGNARSCEAAMAQPGVVLVCSMLVPNAPFEPLERSNAG